MLALGVCFPQSCSNICRDKSTFEFIFDNWFVSTKNEFDVMLCKPDSTEYTRLFAPSPTLP